MPNLIVRYLRFEEEDLQALRRSGSPSVVRPGSSASMRRSMSPAARQRSQSPGSRGASLSFHETVRTKRFTVCVDFFDY